MIFSEEKWMKVAACSRNFVIIFNEVVKRRTVFCCFSHMFQHVEWPFRLLGIWGLDFTPSY